MKKICLFILTITIAVFGYSTDLLAGSKGSYVWGEDENGWYVQYSDGTYAADEFVDGWWLDAGGYLNEEWEAGWIQDDYGWWYQSYEWYPTDEWLKIDGDWYYFDVNSYMVTSSWVGDYYLTANGTMATDCWIDNWYVNSSGKWVATKEEEKRPESTETKKQETQSTPTTKAPTNNPTTQKKPDTKKDIPAKVTQEPKQETKQEAKQDNTEKIIEDVIEDTTEETTEEVPPIDVEACILSEDSNNVLVIGDSEKELDVERLGRVSGIQSFCIYNGKYYSTDGNNIFVQDQDFNAIDQKALMVGHGNAFQLGTNGYGYISGWDDNTIYVVDLEKLELVNTIKLPTTGYTTGVVDDTKNIAYILQRESFPNSLENYKLIAYDYKNDVQISENTLNEQFGALQSCDYKNGKILVTNGLGTSELPNGCRVYDTYGKLCYEYKLESFSRFEPEGVFMDRNSNDIYVTTVNKNMYIIKDKNNDTIKE